MPHNPCMKVKSAASFYFPKQVEVQARDRVLSIECCYQNDRHGVVQTAHMLNAQTGSMQRQHDTGCAGLKPVSADMQGT